MSTYAEIQTRINDSYLNRPDFSAETQTAIKAAIRFYEKKRWQFNETATALATSAGQAYLDLPDNLLVLDDLRINFSGFSGEPLFRADVGFIRDMRIGNAQGLPSHYAVSRKRAELALIPDSAWTVDCYYVKRLTELSAGTDTNAFISADFEDVIVYHATKLMWATVLRNDQEALKYAQLENLALNNVTGLNEQFVSFKLRPTSF